MNVSLAPVPATDFGTYEVSRLASATEMVAAAGRCAHCDAALVSKHGGRTVPGAMIGRRPGATAAWTFTGPFCHPCDLLLATDATA